MSEPLEGIVLELELGVLVLGKDEVPPGIIVEEDCLPSREDLLDELVGLIIDKGDGLVLLIRGGCEVPIGIIGEGLRLT